MHPHPSKTGTYSHQKVSTIELFFDLVFVFMVTQLTLLAEHSHLWTDFLVTGSILVLIWWLYAGWLWLVSALGTGQRVRVFLILAMAGFLAMATVLPRIFSDGAKIFALAYLAVVLLHTTAFIAFSDPIHTQAIAKMAPFNFGAAAFIFCAAWMDADWKPTLLAVGALGLIVASALPRPRGFSIQAEHFAERHGLVILIAFGEAIVAIGSSAKDLPIDGKLLGTSALGMMLIFSLWLRYFSGDDAAAQRELEMASDARREQLGASYWQTHMAMIAGVVLVSAGIRRIVGQAGSEVATASLLGSGTALFLLGHAGFRLKLRLGRCVLEGLGAIASILIIPIAVVVGSTPGLILLVVMLLVLTIAGAQMRQ